MSSSDSTATSGQIKAAVADACSRSTHLLHVLYALQQRLLHIPDEAVREVAEQLGLPVSRIESVVEFYSFFYKTPRGKYNLLLSNCTSCGYQAGGANLLQTLCDRLHVVVGRTRADGLVGVDETSCIGMCDHGAALLVNGIPITGLDSGRIIRIAELVETDTPLAAWPAEWFYIADNIRKGGLLLNNDLAAGDGLRPALARGADATLAEVTLSGLRGRGGAGFSAGMKWKFCREAKGDVRYVVCNADEGEPGTFKDRVLLHSHADAVFEGMTHMRIRDRRRTGLPVSARRIPLSAADHLQAVLATRREQGLLGNDILGRAGFDFDIEIVVGAGAYICGEESALIESLEGKRGMPRNRPPFPVTHGYLGQPTVVNNVETFAAAAHIASRGGAWFRQVGTEKSGGQQDTERQRRLRIARHL